MANPQVFNAVRDSFTILGMFFNEVAREVGTERATEMYAKYAEGFGEAIGSLIREHQADEEAAQKVAAGLEVMFAGFGIEGEFDIAPTTIHFSTSACPIYDGLHAAGVDHHTIEAMCRAASECEATAARRLVPEAEISLTKFRDGADDVCTEVIKLA